MNLSSVDACLTVSVGASALQDVAELARLKILGGKLKKSAARKEPPSAVLQAMQQQRQEAEGALVDGPLGHGTLPAAPSSPDAAAAAAVAALGAPPAGGMGEYAAQPLHAACGPFFYRLSCCEACPVACRPGSAAADGSATATALISLKAPSPARAAPNGSRPGTSIACLRALMFAVVSAVPPLVVRLQLPSHLTSLRGIVSCICCNC
jgi:hypothetical protein